MAALRVLTFLALLIPARAAACQGATCAILGEGATGTSMLQKQKTEVAKMQQDDGFFDVCKEFCFYQPVVNAGVTNQGHATKDMLSLAVTLFHATTAIEADAVTRASLQGIVPLIWLVTCRRCWNTAKILRLI